MDGVLLITKPHIYIDSGTRVARILSSRKKAEAGKTTGEMWSARVYEFGRMEISKSTSTPAEKPSHTMFKGSEATRYGLAHETSCEEVYRQHLINTIMPEIKRNNPTMTPKQLGDEQDKIKVKPSGLISHFRRTFFRVSPDGIVHLPAIVPSVPRLHLPPPSSPSVPENNRKKGGLVEYKCLYKFRAFKFNEIFEHAQKDKKDAQYFPLIKDETTGEIRLDKKHDYYMQCQGNFTCFPYILYSLELTHCLIN